MEERAFKPFQKPSDLILWLEENDILMNLSIEDVEILSNYMEGHGYKLGVLEDVLVRADNCAGDSLEYDKLSIDEIIDTVCEYNYEMIQFAKENLQKSYGFIEFANRSNYLDSLRLEEKKLDVMFDKTCYGKEVQELAVKLADNAIKNILASGDKKSLFYIETNKNMKGFQSSELVKVCEGKVR